MKCTCPKVKDADVWNSFWEVVRQDSSRRNALLEVKHVKTHRSKKEKQELSSLRTICHGRLCEGGLKTRRSHVGWMRDGAKMRASTVQQKRGGVYAAVPYAARFHCLVEVWRDCKELEPKPKEKWVEAWKHRTACCSHMQVPLHEMREKQ